MALVPFTRNTHVPTFRGFDEFDRMFDNMFRNALTNLTAPETPIGSLSMRVNVSETDKNYLVEAELPGIDEKDIDLTVQDGVLTIAGEKESEEETEGKTFHRLERSYGSFTRSLQLPSDADENKVSASMKNGVLEIEIGKRKEQQKQAKRISIGKKS